LQRVNVAQCAYARPNIVTASDSEWIRSEDRATYNMETARDIGHALCAPISFMTFGFPCVFKVFFKSCIAVRVLVIASYFCIYNFIYLLRLFTVCISFIPSHFQN